MKLSDLRSAETVHQEDMANDPDYREEYLKNRLANQVAIEVIRWRTEHNLTQTALAKLLGMRQPNVARLEAGEHTPSLDTLSRLSSRLDINFTIDIDPEDGVSLRSYGHSDDPDEAAVPSEVWPPTSAYLRQAMANIERMRRARTLPSPDRVRDNDAPPSGKLDSSQFQNALTALIASLGPLKLAGSQQYMSRPIVIDAVFGLPSEKVIVALGGSSETGFQYTEITEAIAKKHVGAE